MKVQTIAVGVLVVLLSAANAFAVDLDEYNTDRTEQHTILMSASPYVTKTLSGNSALALGGTPVEIEDFVVGTTPGNTNPSYDLSPPHNIYAYMITDPCVAGPKKKAMIATGNHNTETGGSWAFQGMVDFLVSADTEADWLRKHVEFYIYPLVNPDGRYTASGRDNPEMEADGSFGTDHNRTWHTCGQGLSTIDALTVAMRADTCNDVDFAFDFHGGGSDFVYIMPSQADCPYVQAFAEREPSVPPKLRSGDYRMLRLWPLRPDPEGLNAEFSCTPENDKSGTVQDKLDLGKSYGLAIYDVLIAEDPNDDYLELKEEAENWLVDNLEEQTGELELVGWWKLDESGVSTAADSTGNGHTGTLHNNPTWQPSGGQFDGALSFDEVDDYVTVTDFDYTNESDEFSLGFWFKLADVSGSGYQYVFSHGLEQEYNNLDIYFRESEKSDPGTLTTRIRLNTGGKWQVSTPAALADGQWHMYTITVSSVDGATVYIDDESVLTNSAIKGASFNPGTALYLGAREDLNPDRHYGSPAADDGLLDDVRLYNYALTPDDVDLLYQGSEPCEPSGFICAESPAGDLNDDCKVNFLDFQILAADWLKGIVYDEGVSANEFFSSYYSPDYEAIDATWTHMLGGGDNRVLVVALIAEDDDVNNLAIASVKYNNVEMNIVPNSNVIATSDPNEVKTVLYYLLEEDLPEPGYYTVAALYAANDVVQRLGGSVSRANVVQQAPEAVATNSNTGQDTISTNITTVTANAWVVDVVAGDDQGSFSTTTGGMTERWDVSGSVSTRGSTAAGATKSPASAGLTTMSWSYSSGTYMLAHSIAAFETLD